MLPRTLFSEEHEIFRGSVRRFIEKEVTPYHAQWEQDGIVDRDLWRKAGEQGLLCCTVPVEYGGPGGDFLDTQNFTLTELSVLLLELISKIGWQCE